MSFRTLPSFPPVEKLLLGASKLLLFAESVRMPMFDLQTHKPEKSKKSEHRTLTTHQNMKTKEVKCYRVKVDDDFSN